VFELLLHGQLCSMRRCLTEASCQQLRENRDAGVARLAAATHVVTNDTSDNLEGVDDKLDDIASQIA
jgi:hypothetical protein